VAARGLRREISLTAATAIVIGSVIGSGIFRTPSLVAQQFPQAWVILLLWTLGGLVTIAGALTVAELATMYPRAGGPYVFVKEAFGETPGFLAGWIYFVLGKLAIGAAVAIVFAEHASFLAEEYLGFPLSESGILFLAAWALVVLTFVNWIGLRFGAGVNTFLTVLKALALAAVTLMAFAFARGDPTAAPTAAPFEGGGGLAVAVLAVLFAYNSWINATIVGEEVKDPARNLPRSLFWGTLLVTVLYVGANASYLWILGPDGMARNALVATAAASRVVAWGGVFIAASVLVSAFGNLNGGILTGARLPFSMARDGFLPRAIARVNERHVPDGALFLELAGFLVLLFGLRTFTALIAAATFASWLILAAICVGFFVLRRTAPDVDRPYRVHGYPFVPAVFALAAAFVVGVTALQQMSAVLVTLVTGIVGAGLLFFRRPGEAPSAEAVAEA